MIYSYAEKIYDLSLKLKRYRYSDFLFKRKRLQVIDELKEIGELVFDLINELKSDSSFAPVYYDLALFMYKSLFECMTFLASKGKNDRQTIWRYIHGFHNLPRAFLPVDHSMKVSAETAMEYYRPYIKAD